MTFCEVLFLRLHATFQGIYFICEPKFYARMHIKIKWQWKSTLRGKTPLQLYLTLGLSIKAKGLKFAAISHELDAYSSLEITPVFTNNIIYICKTDNETTNGSKLLARTSK